MITHANPGDLVQVWQDQSGNGNHFRQDINSQRPQLVAYANLLCAQPLIHFDVGRRTYLCSTLKASGAKTIFIVFLQPSISGNPETLLSIKGLANTYSEILCTDAPAYSPLSFIADVTSSVSGGVLTGAMGDNMTFLSSGNIFTLTYNGSVNSSPSSYTANNNTVAATVTTSGPFGRLPYDSTTIGGRAPQQNYSFFSGDIGEIILYNRVLTAAEITQVEHYLADKFGFFGTCNVLHTATLNFVCKAVNNAVELNWNPYGAGVNEYIIERSTDASRWDSIGAIQDAPANTRYSFTDNQPFGGVNYYRLIIKTTGGRILYSNSLSATVPLITTTAYTIQPNPVKEYMYIRSATREMLHIYLLNAEGRLVKEINALSNMPIATGNLPRGIYWATINGKSEQVTLKFFKP
ncbi:hypothetical protein GCM10027043_17640 [Ferruginibacter profundus]